MKILNKLRQQVGKIVDGKVIDYSPDLKKAMKGYEEGSDLIEHLKRRGFLLSDVIVESIIKKAEADLVLSPEGGWIEFGGSGSGHRGHKGVKGQKGGSAPGRAKYLKAF